MNKTRLRVVAPPPDDREYWKKLCNFLFVHNQDTLFRWAKSVEVYIQGQENEKKRGAA